MSHRLLIDQRSSSPSRSSNFSRSERVSGFFFSVFATGLTSGRELALLRELPGAGCERTGLTEDEGTGFGVTLGAGIDLDGTFEEGFGLDVTPGERLGDGRCGATDFVTGGF